VLLAAAAVAPGHAADGDADYRKRIATLEARVDQLERLVTALTSRPRPAKGADLSAVAPATEAASPAAKPAATADSGEAAAAGPAATPAASEDDKNALHQLYVVRDEAVTLKPGRFEADFELSYSRDNGFLQSSWALGAVASLRYGATGGWEFGVRVPYDWTHRHTATATPTGLDVDLAAFGDVSFDVSKLVMHETPTLPGIVVSAGLSLPTGIDPYGPGALKPGTDPSDPFAFYRNAGGHYAAEAGIELFKTVDPFAYFGGVKISYPFARDVGGVEVFPGYSIAYNLGATLALSDSSSLGFAVLGAIKTDMETGGVAVPDTATLPMSTAISVLQRISDGFYVEPSITIGLTEDAPDAVLAVKTTKTF
jgi:hypothetical protein